MMEKTNHDKLRIKKEYEQYNSTPYPYINICASVDITKLDKLVKESNKPFFMAFLFAVTRISNEIPAFCRRALNNEIVEIEKISPCFEIISNKGEKQLYVASYIDNIYRFVEYALSGIELVKSGENNAKTSDRNDIIFASSIDVAFTSIIQPYIGGMGNTVPCITWGKITQKGELITIPVSVMGHGGLIASEDIAEFFNKLQALIDICDTLKVYETSEEEAKAREYNTRIIRSADINQRMRSQYPYKD